MRMVVDARHPLSASGRETSPRLELFADIPAREGPFFEAEWSCNRELSQPRNSRIVNLHTLSLWRLLLGTHGHVLHMWLRLLLLVLPDFGAYGGACGGDSPRAWTILLADAGCPARVPLAQLFRMACATGSSQIATTATAAAGSLPLHAFP